VRVGIASASDHEVRALRVLLDDVPAEVAWIATSGTAAARSARSDPPDALVVCVGSELDAAALIRRVTMEQRLPIVVAADDPAERIHDVYAAISAGAVDAATIPRQAGGRLTDPSRLVLKLRRLAPRGRRRRLTVSGPAEPLLVLAASTGGPDALSRLLTDLPPRLSARVLVVQHIGDEFVDDLAAWLSSSAGRVVEPAGDGALLGPDRILLVRTAAQPSVDAHGRIRYGRSLPGAPQPSIDALFTGLAGMTSLRGVAALLTGMGSDGAEGLLTLRAAGWVTFAQDARSSTVFGMPRAAAARGAASEVVPLDRMAARAVGALTGIAGEGGR
jgi:two-component system response regulator WspF